MFNLGNKLLYLVRHRWVVDDQSVVLLVLLALQEDLTRLALPLVAGSDVVLVPVRPVQVVLPHCYCVRMVQNGIGQMLKILGKPQSSQ